MSKLRKILLAVLAVVVLVPLCLVGYVLAVWDQTFDVALPELKASTDPEVIERGRYLVYGPAHCASCHTSLEEGARVAAGEDVPLAGGMAFAAPPLGTFYSRNLTPDPETGLGNISDGQIFRMMQYAVKPDGTATIEPMMPFGNMSEDDQIAIVSYLRSQPAVQREVPDNEWTLIGKAIRVFAPTFKPRASISPPPSAPAEEATVERGEYLARYVANCVGCHTPRDMTTFEAIGPEFSGGLEMEPAPLPGVDPAIWFRTPNLTPDPTGVLRNFPNKEAFVARFRAGRGANKGSPMPWEPFARMSDADIGALYLYFSSLEPVPHDVGPYFFKKEE